MIRWRHAGIALACALSAGAAEPDEPATPVVEDSWRLRALVVSFENDNFFSGSDRHYTQGARVTWLYDAGPRTWATEMARSTLRLFTKRVEDSEAKLAVSIGQDMFTPENTTTATLIPTDRPYAAWSYLAAGFHIIDVAPIDAVGVKNRETSLIAEVSLGMVGPAAQGAQFQNAWHDLIGGRALAGLGQPTAR